MLQKLRELSKIDISNLRSQIYSISISEVVLIVNTVYTVLIRLISITTSELFLFILHKLSQSNIILMAASSISVNSEAGAKGEVASSVKKVAKNYPLHTSTSLGEGFHSLYECPINEENIESVLDESIAVTAAMRTQLAALKEDLKRLGGGSNMSTNLKPVHIQRRLEVASHLAVAFLQYVRFTLLISYIHISCMFVF